MAKRLHPTVNQIVIFCRSVKKERPFDIKRMPVLCSSKKCGAKAILKRPKTGDALCKVAPFLLFEYHVHKNILIRTIRHPLRLC